MFEYSSIVSLAKDKVYCPRYCGLSMYQVFIFLLCSTNFMSELASKFRFLNLNKTQFVDQKLKTLLGGLHLQLAFGIKIWCLQQQSRLSFILWWPSNRFLQLERLSCCCCSATFAATSVTCTNSSTSQFLVSPKEKKSILLCFDIWGFLAKSEISQAISPFCFFDYFSLLWLLSQLISCFNRYVFINFYRTQMSLVRSLCPDVRHSMMFLRLNWCDSGWWGYQVNTNW